MMDLFTPLVPPDRLHPNFKRLLSDTDWDVREVLAEWADGFIDRDHKFVREFQTTFNSSWWELYLYAVFKSLGVAIDFSCDAPDFVARDLPMVVEAVISSHAENSTPEWMKSIDDLTGGSDIEKRYTETLARLYNSLDAKRRLFDRRYSGLPHVQGKSFVIALHNFGTPDSFQLGDVAMQRLLYDIEKRETFLKNDTIALPLGIFNRPEFACVSAIMYSSVATYGKVRALGRSTEHFVFQATRIRNNLELIPIAATKGDYVESLRDGLRVFHNPNANAPLPFELFEPLDIREFRMIDGEMFTTCHPDGDLCMRQVMRLSPQD
ncbi:hypothetical protein HFO61_03905 [Rhizobium leguminosarum]|uniref:hypothetical protein n=1 Tax=Rhizobium leguminosarum TaxID=384 RepID=UPI001C9875C6|nr:hypothetical protein [Rhizobium leguminosarum]MBY5545992.1 hypothetical protein [Rhizobium leguminosarum]